MFAVFVRTVSPLNDRRADFSLTNIVEVGSDVFHQITFQLMKVKTLLLIRSRNRTVAT